MLTGLTLNGGRAQRDGPGDHARAAASFLTGAHPYKTDGKDIRNGISVDQAAAEKIGHLTRFASLELGGERAAQAGNCDSGYSCAYSSNISWRTPTSPMSKEVNPRAVFDRLFGPADVAAEDRAPPCRASPAAEEHPGLRGRGRRRLAAQARPQRRPQAGRVSVRRARDRGPGAEGRKRRRPARCDGLPARRTEFAEHVRLMMDMIVLAFQTDSTRIVTFMYQNEGSNRSYPEIGVRAGHHELSHHGGNRDKQAQISKINRFHLSLLADFLQKLNAVKEGDGTLLQSTMIMYGSGLSDGNRHNHDNLPILLAGRGGGTISSRPPPPLPQGNPLDEPLSGDVRPHGRRAAEVRRQHGETGVVKWGPSTVAEWAEL